MSFKFVVVLMKFSLYLVFVLFCFSFFICFFFVSEYILV